MLVGEGLTQREVGDVAGISEVTIRDRYTELLEVAGVMTDGELAGVGSG
jgi:transcription initiation factor TFIIIB Brf1 subunit/transcription initiation factor TFIIB